VVEMKDTIKSLRNENRLLAQAMKVLSEGADLDTVIGTLPEVSDKCEVSVR
jgi:hypothetical protein